VFLKKILNLLQEAKDIGSKGIQNGVMKNAKKLPTDTQNITEVIINKKGDNYLPPFILLHK
jgi:hypothetical protein